MTLTILSQKEQDRVVYMAIKEGRTMTAAEIREKTGFDRRQIQSSLLKLYHNGYITIAVRDRKKASVWKIK